jgi:hypothetical protein
MTTTNPKLLELAAAAKNGLQRGLCAVVQPMQLPKNFRKIHAARRAQGLTVRGTPRKTKQRVELAGLPSCSAEYRTRYTRLWRAEHAHV